VSILGAITPQEAAARRKRGMELTGSEGESIRVISSFNADLLPPFLAEALDRTGVRAQISMAPFGALAREAADPASELYRDEPASVLLVVAVEDWLAPLFEEPPGPTGLVEERLAELEQIVATILDRLPRTTVFVSALGAPHAPLESVLGPGSPERGQAAVDRFLAGVAGLAGDRVVAIDWEWHARTIGGAYRDDRLWYLGRMRLNPVGLAALAELFARHHAAYRGAAKKVAAVDLDGTLWGGIVGEAGVGGLELGGDGTGLAFQDFQRELLKLRGAGVVLVLCSKNNQADVDEVFEKHAGMVLKRDHFAAERVNWQDKATNLRELAAELGLGIDSFVFIDDNPVERDWVAQALPEVAVPDLPEDPASRPGFLRTMPHFQRVALTSADAGRSESYAAEGRRRRLATAATSFEDFLATLEQEVTVEPVHEGTLARAAQLCQRTNQFNLTTRRHTAADIDAMLHDSDWELHTVAVRDRYGDSGVVGLVALHQTTADAVELDTFLLSCRVLGRRVEDALLAWSAERARGRGARLLVGRYVPTKKNAQAAPFYPDRGFEPAGDGVFHLDLTNDGPAPPTGVALREAANA
jgi:FkbH-like protein